MEKINTINRREALRRTALVMGSALSVTTVAGIMQGCKADPKLAWTPAYFEDKKAKFISLMSDTIIPKTATPGAREAGVPKFIEDMVSNVYTAEQQAQFNAGLEACQAWCQSEGGDDFIYLSPEKQLELAESLDKAAKARRMSGRSAAAAESEEGANEADFFWNFKELTVAGFFTSEAGATQVLQYKAIPTEYKGCIPLSEAGGKTWAT